MRRTQNHVPVRELTCLDLFSGCGGFSLGVHRAGWQVKASVDFDPKAVDVYTANFANSDYALCRDLTKYSPADLERETGLRQVDMIIGGPPCQGFSQVRQRDGANNGGRLIDDPRRRLYQQYFEYVDHFKPMLFVMENVLGIRSADGGRYYQAVHTTAREHGYRVIGTVINAWEFGVPQKRRRQFIIGTRINLPKYFRPQTITSMVESRDFKLGHAIGDLPRMSAGTGSEVAEYDLALRQKQLADPLAAWFLRNIAEISKAKKLTAHVARPHSERDLRDFEKIGEGENAKHVLERGVELEFPYDRSTFHDRYTRQSRHDYCSTIVAHLSRDGLMFIHPTQLRSLTVREAARIQTFPDWFQFPVSRTHQYRVIGNAVPPLVGWAVGNAAASFVREVMEASRRRKSLPSELIPVNEREAADSLLHLLHLQDRNELTEATKVEFLKGWFGAAFLFPGLHPDSAHDHGSEIQPPEEALRRRLKRLNERLAGPHFVQSGWPTILVDIGIEAARRFTTGELRDDDYYCSAAAHAGLSSVAKSTASHKRTEHVIAG
jgi:DNA (cytosine-5)-methyltransferase 1